MKMNSSKMMFISTLTFTILMMMTSNSILLMWMNMEINMIMLLPILTKTKKITDQIMKYMIIQTTASSTMLISIMINMTEKESIQQSNMMMMSMMMKMGIMPTHLWMPELMQSISWNKCIIMSTIQKIPPTMIISQMTNMKMMEFPMILSLLMSPSSGFSQTSLKKMMAYSSIANSPWMIYSMNISKKLFLLFFLVYMTITTMTMVMMKKLKLTFTTQMKKMKKINQTTMMLNMMSNSGMPPTLGFLPKWLIMQNLMKTSMIMPMMMIASSMMMTFMYLKLINPMMTNSNNIKKNKSNKNKFMIYNLVNTLGIPTILTNKMI